MEQHHALLAAGADVESGGVMAGGAHVGQAAGNRTLWFVHDSCGMVCATMTWLLVLYAEFVVNFVIVLPSKSFWYSLLNGAVFNSLAMLALASHVRTMLTDPVRTSLRSPNTQQSINNQSVNNDTSTSAFQGAVPKGNATKEYVEGLQLKPGEVMYKCAKCCSIKPERAHHCRLVHT